MNRRQMLLGLLATGAATASGATIADGAEKHWLDSRSSQDIEQALRAVGGGETYRRFKREMASLARAGMKRAKRERRADNTVLWSGCVTDPLPGEIVARLREVKAERREISITSANSEFEWQGITIPVGSRVLVDARCTPYLGRFEIPAKGEIIDTPHKGRRVHIWPA